MKSPAYLSTSAQSPHWVATDGRRIVVVNEPGGEPRLWMLRIDSSTGQLSLDESFRDRESGRPGVSLIATNGRFTARQVSPFRTAPYSDRRQGTSGRLPTT